jgi:hypothetical protein
VGGGLGIEDVERQPAEPAISQRGERRGGVEHLAARGVDEDRARREGGDLRGADHAARLRGQRHVQRQDVGAAQQLVERGGALGKAGDVRIVRAEPHPERAGEARHAAADLPESHDA